MDVHFGMGMDGLSDTHHLSVLQGEGREERSRYICTYIPASQSQISQIAPGVRGSFGYDIIVVLEPKYGPMVTTR